MKVKIETDEPLATSFEDLVGNVYQVRGGSGARRGHMHIIVAIYDYKDCCGSNRGVATLTVNSDGLIVGGNSYACHYFMEKVPIAKCHGIEDMQLIIRSL